MKNKDVVKAWSEGRAAHTKHLKTDGQTLWSYNLPIGKTEGGAKIVFDYTTSGGHFMSNTTSLHVGLAQAVPHVLQKVL